MVYGTTPFGQRRKLWAPRDCPNIGSSFSSVGNIMSPSNKSELKFSSFSANEKSRKETINTPSSFAVYLHQTPVLAALRKLILFFLLLPSIIRKNLNFNRAKLFHQFPRIHHLSTLTRKKGRCFKILPPSEENSVMMRCFYTIKRKFQGACSNGIILEWENTERSQLTLKSLEYKIYVDYRTTARES